MHSAKSPPSYPPQNTQSAPEASCPVRRPADSRTQHESSASTLSKLNPLNYMPSNLSQSRAPSQSVYLPVERETSSIPRGDADTNWEYPSPQQMYNAMIRKGYDDTPQDAVESMVAVHNFLNEGAWLEIVGWEQRFSRGLFHGWDYCKRGEAAFESTARADAATPQPRLLRFQGRPREMTPKAKVLQALGQLYPAKFKYEFDFGFERSRLTMCRGDPPFDRHDWYVQRQMQDGKKQEVRYVIDYYSGPPEPTGEPVFYLDVRPAVDTPTAAAERLMRWGGDFWYRASGAEARYGAKT